MIRQAQLEDVAAIVRLGGRFLATTTYGRLFIFDQARIEDLTCRLLEVGTIFVAERDGRIAGFLAGLEGEDPYSGLRYADEVAWFVMPEERRGTAGVRLLHAFEQWARDKGLSFVKMVAPWDGIHDVAGFLTRNGYQALETSFVKRL